MSLTRFPLIALVCVATFSFSDSQNSPNACSKYFRNVHRMGANVQGRLEIPTDDYFPKYKLRIGFSSPIHHMTIRHTRAKDTGTHREFVIDPSSMRKDGKLSMDVFIRLSRAFGSTSRVKRIVYNNQALCGDALEASELDEEFMLETTSPAPGPTSTLPFLFPTNATTLSSWKNKNKDYEEEEDIWSK